MARRGENIYKRKDGRYEGRYIKQYDVNGKAVYGYVYSRNYADIKDKLTKYKCNKAGNFSGSDVILSYWLTSWIENETGIKESTKLLYKRHITNNIIPRIGEIPLKKLNSNNIQQFINSLEYAPATVKLIYTILKSALSAAADKGYATDSWSKVRLPKRTDSEVEILTPLEQHRLETLLSGKNDIGILICLYTGLRIGELCALKWSDIDFDKAIIHVNGTQSRIDGTLKITPPKSKASFRDIPIPEFLLKKLIEHKNHSEFVISNNNKPVDVRVYRRRFKKLLQIAELPDIKFHALRHTFSSRALEVGMDYKTLSEILGHASVSTTMDLYVHSLDEHKKNQMNKLTDVYNFQSK